MREKRHQLVITFATTTGAMAMEKFCMEQKIAGRLIPVPREITAGCGLAWKTEPGLRESIAEALQEHGLIWEEMYVLEL